MRTSRLRISTVLVALGALLALPAQAAPEPPSAFGAGCGSQRTFAPGKNLPGRAPLAIGDSVLLGAAEEVAALGFEVDVRGCRPMLEGLEVLSRVADARKLPQVAVIALGSNSTVERRDLRRALRLLGPDRVLGLVTPIEVGGKGGADAALMREVAACRPKRTVLLDWVRYESRHPGLTYDDGIHLTPDGQHAMARLLRRALPERIAQREIPPASCAS